MTQIEKKEEKRIRRSRHNKNRVYDRKNTNLVGVIIFGSVRFL
jgi:hypothetical protein